MIADKIMTLEACRYDDLPKYTKIFNCSELEYHLWIYLNPDDVRNSYFYRSKEVGPEADNSKLFPDTVERMSTCWIRANTEYLNIKPGKHTYKLMFVERSTDTDFSLYVSYYIQDDSPEKPYVYMKLGEQVPEPAHTIQTYAEEHHS